MEKNSEEIKKDTEENFLISESSSQLFHPITQQVLNKDLEELTREEFIDLVANTMEIYPSPILSNKEIESLYRYYIKQYKKVGERNRLLSEFAQSLLRFMCNMEKKEKEDTECTLDRAYRIFYEVAEKYPKEMSSMITGTNALEENVSPEVFFDVYIKIKESPVLNRYFGGTQLSLLEYNMSYMGTERYTKSLLNKINFTDSKSCSESSTVMNLAAILADYAQEGSYSSNYSVDKEIINTFKIGAKNQNSIYLLGSKARYIIDRLEKGWPPFAHKEQIFELCPNKVAFYTQEGLYILDIQSQELLEKYNEYKNVSERLDTPPKHLIDEAIKRGDTEIVWTPDRSDRALKKQLAESLISKMSLLNLASLNQNEINNTKLKEYTNLVGTDYKIFIEEEFKIKISDFSIQEQFYFLEYIQTQTNKSVVFVKDFIHVYSANGFRTFLSLEHGGKEMGGKILSLGERFKDEPEIARNIFSKYSEIIDSADSIFENITSHFKKEIALSPDSINKIKDSLYKRGADLLVRFEAEKNMAPDEVLAELENIHTDTIATLSVFKQTLRSGSSYSLEDIIGAEFRKRSGEEFSSKEVQEMVSIYKNNWKNFEPQEIMQEIIKKFEESLTGVDVSKNEVYTFAHEGTINAFVKFADVGGRVKYASALNVDSALHGLSLGEAMMDEALAKEAQTSVLCAMCESNKDSAMRYFEKGFIATGFSPEVPPFLDI